MEPSPVDEVRQVKVILKIGETQRIVSASCSDAIGDIKKREFPGAQRARFLCRGRELMDNWSVLEALPSAPSVSEELPELIIHCVVRAESTTAATEAAPVRSTRSSPRHTEREDSLNIESCSLLRLVLGAVCLLMWMLYFSVPELFAKSSVVTLVSLTVGYTLFAISVKPSSPRPARQDAPVTVTM